MKIALVNEWLDPGRGGAETAVVQYVRHLLDAGIGVTLVTRSDVELPGADTLVVEGEGGSRSRGSIRFPIVAARMAEGAGCDLIHSVPPIPNADIYQPRGGTVAETLAQNVALRRSTSARLLKHVLLKLSPKQRQLLNIERELLHRKPAPVVVAISDYVVDQLKRHYAFPAEQISKVYNAVDPDTDGESKRQADREAVRQKHGIAEDECVALLIAHNFKLKGIPCWLEAAQRIHMEHGRLIRSVIVGKGKSGRWESVLRHRGLQDDVLLTGPVEDVRAYSHAADFLVHPSWYDPCSRVVLEAVSSGLPCIASRFDGASEMIRHGENGYILETPGDISAMVEFAVFLARMEPAQRKLAGGGVDPYRISMKRHADEMIRVYEETLSRRERS